MSPRGHTEAEKQIIKRMQAALAPWILEVRSFKVTSDAHIELEQLLEEFNACAKSQLYNIVVSHESQRLLSAIDLTEHFAPEECEFCHPRVQNMPAYPNNWKQNSIQALQDDITTILQHVSNILGNKFHEIIRLLAYMFDCAFSSYYPENIYSKFLLLASRIIQYGSMNYKHDTLYIVN
jgi:hypothetical protein